MWRECAIALKLEVERLHHSVRRLTPICSVVGARIVAIKLVLIQQAVSEIRPPAERDDVLLMYYVGGVGTVSHI